MERAKDDSVHDYLPPPPKREAPAPPKQTPFQRRLKARVTNSGKRNRSVPRKFKMKPSSRATVSKKATPKDVLSEKEEEAVDNKERPASVKVPKNSLIANAMRSPRSMKHLQDKHGKQKERLRSRARLGITTPETLSSEGSSAKSGSDKNESSDKTSSNGSKKASEKTFSRKGKGSGMVLARAKHAFFPTPDDDHADLDTFGPTAAETVKSSQIRMLDFSDPVFTAETMHEIHVRRQGLEMPKQRSQKSEDLHTKIRGWIAANLPLSLILRESTMPPKEQDRMVWRPQRDPRLEMVRGPGGGWVSTHSPQITPSASHEQEKPSRKASVESISTASSVGWLAEIQEEGTLERLCKDNHTILDILNEHGIHKLVDLHELLPEDLDQIRGKFDDPSVLSRLHQYMTSPPFIRDMVVQQQKQRHRASLRVDTDIKEEETTYQSDALTGTETPEPGPGDPGDGRKKTDGRTVTFQDEEEDSEMDTVAKDPEEEREEIVTEALGPLIYVLMFVGLFPIQQWRKIRSQTGKRIGQYVHYLFTLALVVSVIFRVVRRTWPEEDSIPTQALDGFGAGSLHILAFVVDVAGWLILHSNMFQNSLLAHQRMGVVITSSPNVSKAIARRRNLIFLRNSAWFHSQNHKWHLYALLCICVPGSLMDLIRPIKALVTQTRPTDISSFDDMMYDAWGVNGYAVSYCISTIFIVVTPMAAMILYSMTYHLYIAQTSMLLAIINNEPAIAQADSDSEEEETEDEVSYSIEMVPSISHSRLSDDDGSLAAEVGSDAPGPYDSVLLAGLGDMAREESLNSAASSAGLLKKKAASGKNVTSSVFSHTSSQRRLDEISDHIEQIRVSEHEILPERMSNVVVTSLGSLESIRNAYNAADAAGLLAPRKPTLKSLEKPALRPANENPVTKVKTSSKAPTGDDLKWMNRLTALKMNRHFLEQTTALVRSVFPALLILYLMSFVGIVGTYVYTDGDQGLAFLANAIVIPGLAALVYAAMGHSARRNRFLATKLRAIQPKSLRQSQHLLQHHLPGNIQTPNPQYNQVGEMLGFQEGPEGAQTYADVFTRAYFLAPKGETGVRVSNYQMPSGPALEDNIFEPQVMLSPAFTEGNMEAEYDLFALFYYGVKQPKALECKLDDDFDEPRHIPLQPVQQLSNRSISVTNTHTDTVKTVSHLVSSTRGREALFARDAEEDDVRRFNYLGNLSLAFVDVFYQYRITIQHAIGAAIVGMFVSVVHTYVQYNSCTNFTMDEVHDEDCPSLWNTMRSLEFAISMFFLFMWPCVLATMTLGAYRTPKELVVTIIVPVLVGFCAAYLSTEAHITWRVRSVFAALLVLQSAHVAHYVAYAGGAVYRWAWPVSMLVFVSAVLIEELLIVWYWETRPDPRGRSVVVLLFHPILFGVADLLLDRLATRVRNFCVKYHYSADYPYSFITGLKLSMSLLGRLYLLGLGQLRIQTFAVLLLGSARIGADIAAPFLQYMLYRLLTRNIVKAYYKSESYRASALTAHIVYISQFTEIWSILMSFPMFIGIRLYYGMSIPNPGLLVYSFFLQLGFQCLCDIFRSKLLESYLDMQLLSLWGVNLTKYARHCLYWTVPVVLLFQSSFVRVVISGTTDWL